MYVCVCLAVSKSEVEGAIENGAHSREAVTRACRAGGDCGACHGMIATMIDDHLEDMACGMTPPPASAERLVAETSLVRARRPAADQAA